MSIYGIEQFLQKAAVRNAIERYEDLNLVFFLWNGAVGFGRSDLFKYFIDKEINPLEFMHTIDPTILRNSHYCCTEINQIVIPACIQTLESHSDVGPFTGMSNIELIRFEDARIDNIPDHCFQNMSGLDKKLNIIWPDKIATFKKIPKGFNWNAGTNVTVHCVDGDITYAYKPLI